MTKLKEYINCIHKIFEKIPMDILSLLARLGMAGIFWRSAMTKIAINEEVTLFSFSQVLNTITLNWTVSEFTYTLFENEYDLPLLSPELGAHLAIAAEILLPLALVFGFASRLSAFAMLGMTAVIQLFVYPNLWPDHSIWAATLLIIMVSGPGRFSLDHLIKQKFSNQ